MKRWQIVFVLPLEVWVDIFSFPWISRRKFGQLVDRIGNFKFAEHAQFYLHEWGRRTLGKVVFDQNRFYIQVGYALNPVTLPQTPLPENIRYFDHIGIYHFDANTMDFLARIRALLTNTNVQIDAANIPSDCLDNLRTILTHLAPLLAGIQIQSMSCNESTMPVMGQLFPEKLAKSKVLKIIHCTEERINPIMNWITQSDGPRMGGLDLYYNESGSVFEQIFKAIREQFLSAKTGCTFALIFRLWGHSVAGFHLKNGIGEELHGAWFGDGRGRFFQITRHPANCSTAKVLKWINANTGQKDQGCIRIYQPTVGPLAAAQMDVLPVEVEEVQQQKPCSSKFGCSSSPPVDENEAGPTSAKKMKK